MTLLLLQLRSFRNYQEVEFRFRGPVTVIVGPNGSGKSNFVDATYLVTYGKVLRGKDADAIQWGRSRASVAGRFSFSDSVEKTVRVELGEGVKRIQIDGQILKNRTELIGRFPVIISSAEDLWIVGGDPRARRRFLDGVVALLDVSYMATLREFGKVLRHRNALLAEAKERDKRLPPEVLAAWTERFVDLGAVISHKRWTCARDLQPWFEHFYRKLTGKDASAELVYGDGRRESFSPTEAREELRKTLADRQKPELRRGITLAGPHLDDLKLYIAGVDIRKFGSRGQAKCAAISLRLAQAKLIEKRTKEPPVVVVDDAFSDLDDEKAARVLNLTEGYQTILTTAEEERASAIVGRSEGVVQILKLKDGRLEVDG